ncbi:ketoacyl-ACP synthase III [Pendulispora rubella]|uniref:Ketoacyl-ACP synthase III n=1 Tax=Pendulispora rubella TaxID=2741070 RepID=A0ABZ2KTV6_9BACT
MNVDRLRGPLPTRLKGPAVALTGIGHYFPGEPVSNEFFERLEGSQVTDAWIRKNTGVETRHWPDPTRERHVEMGAKAARLALEDAGLGVDDVELIIGTTSTSRPRSNPSSLKNGYMDIAPPLQRELGAHRAFVFDCQGIACAGFLYASMLAQAVLGSMNLRTALVVCAENPKPILNFDYKYSVLFGGGAAAGVWQTTEGTSGLLDVHLNSDGRYFDAFDIDENDKMIMHGKQIGQIGPRKLIEASRTLLARNDLVPTDIDWFIPHQANINLIREVVDAIELPWDRVLLNLHKRGNTSSVGAPSCLSEHVREGIVKPGDRILTVSIGRGFSWGAMLFQYAGGPSNGR